jgi:hypothetical protein
MPIKLRHERLSFHVSLKVSGAAEKAHREFSAVISPCVPPRLTTINTVVHVVQVQCRAAEVRGRLSAGLYRMLHRWHHRLFQAIDGQRRFISAGQRDKEALLVLHLLLKSADVHLAIGDGWRREFRELAKPIFPAAGILAVP